MPSIYLTKKEVLIAIQNYVKADLNPEIEWAFKIEIDPYPDGGAQVHCKPKAHRHKE